MSSAVILALAMGLRHGTDPDHLTAIDGLSRIRPNVWNGVYFAIGHGVVVTLLAVGVGGMLAQRAEFLGPWILLAIGAINLWRVFMPQHHHGAHAKIFIAQPFFLGMIFAAGFETASQFGALMLANRLNPWLLGVAFTIGMIAVDGLDGALAASTQREAALGEQRAVAASTALGLLVAVCSLVLAAFEVAKVDLEWASLPLGILLFIAVITIRLRSRRKAVVPVSGYHPEHRNRRTFRRPARISSVH